MILRTISKLVTLFFVLLLFQSSLFAQGWEEDISTLRGQVRIIGSIVKRHPNFIKQNVRYKKNPLNVLRHVNALHEELGTDGNNLSFEAIARTASEYTSEGEVIYDQEKISLLKADLKATLELVQAELTDYKLEALGNDLVYILKQSKKLLKNYFKLLPFIYNGDGIPFVNDFSKKSVGLLVEKIANSTVNEIHSYYNNLIKHHIETITETGNSGVIAVFNSFRNNYVGGKEKILVEALTPIGKAGKNIKKRSASIEEVATLVGLFRGNFGRDCATTDVPYYQLVKGTKTYLIRKSLDYLSIPAGYAFVAPVNRNGKTIPYVISIGGETLTNVDVREVIYMVGKVWDADEVVLGRLGKTLFAVKEGMFKSVENVNVEMPHGWEIIDKHWSGSEYDASKLKKGKLVKLDRVSTSEIEYVNTPYSRPKAVDEFNVKERATIGVFCLDGYESDKRIVERIFKLSPKQLQAASSIIDTGPNNPFTAERFYLVWRELDYGFKDLLSLDLLTRVYSLSNLYKQIPKIATEKEWNEAFENINKRLTVELNNTSDLGKFRRYMKAKLSIPEKYWVNELVENMRHGYMAEFKVVVIRLFNRKLKTWPKEFWDITPELMRDSEARVTSAMIAAINSNDKRIKKYQAVIDKTAINASGMELAADEEKTKSPEIEKVNSMLQEKRISLIKNFIDRKHSKNIKRFNIFTEPYFPVKDEVLVSDEGVTIVLRADESLGTAIVDINDYISDKLKESIKLELLKGRKLIEVLNLDNIIRSEGKIYKEYPDLEDIIVRFSPNRRMIILGTLDNNEIYEIEEILFDTTPNNVRRSNMWQDIHRKFLEKQLRHAKSGRKSNPNPGDGGVILFSLQYSPKNMPNVTKFLAQLDDTNLMDKLEKTGANTHDIQTFLTRLSNEVINAKYLHANVGIPGKIANDIANEISNIDSKELRKIIEMKDGSVLESLISTQTSNGNTGEVKTLLEAYIGQDIDLLDKISSYQEHKQKETGKLRLNRAKSTFSNLAKGLIGNPDKINSLGDVDQFIRTLVNLDEREFMDLLARMKQGEGRETWDYPRYAIEEYLPSKVIEGEEVSDNSLNPDVLFMISEGETIIEKVLKTLPEEYAQIYKMLVYEGKTLEEIGDHFDVSKETIRVKWKRLHRLIRAELSKKFISVEGCKEIVIKKDKTPPTKPDINFEERYDNKGMGNVVKNEKEGESGNKREYKFDPKYSGKGVNDLKQQVKTQSHKQYKKIAKSNKQTSKGKTARNIEKKNAKKTGKVFVKEGSKSYREKFIR